MKICIPTKDDRGPESIASNHFGSAPYFVLADVESGDLKTVPNPECHKHHQSCHHVQFLKAHAVDAVVCEGIGRQAVAGLREAGIDVLGPTDGTVSEILETVSAGEARPLSADHVRGCGPRRRRRRAGDGRGRRRGYRHGKRQGRCETERSTSNAGAQQ